MREEQFTMTLEGPGGSPAAWDRWQEEMNRGFLRMQNFVGMVMNPTEPEVGLTPRQEIYRKNKSGLYRYESRRTHRTPVLFVPNLGISRPYVFDLMPRGSFIEHMTQQGFDMFLVDWGVFGPEDNDFSVEDAVVKVLPRLAKKALEASGASDISVLGYCMGAPLSASFLTTHPDFPLRNYIDMAGPIDFAQVGTFGLWLDPRFFDVDKYVDTLGSIPADMVKAGFKLLKPTMDLTTNLNLWWNLWNPQYLKGYHALNKWANEYVAFPGEFFRQWVKEFYQQNKLLRGELTMGGRRVDLKAITCPVLAVGAREDNIAPPGSVKPLIEAVASTDREYVELPGGHISLIAGRGASVHCWPKVSAWLAARSS
jgi:polyhydroxyalkanoate synthase